MTRVFALVAAVSLTFAAPASAQIQNPFQGLINQMVANGMSVAAAQAAVAAAVVAAAAAGTVFGEEVLSDDEASSSSSSSS